MLQSEIDDSWKDAYGQMKGDREMTIDESIRMLIDNPVRRLLFLGRGRQQ